MGSKKEKEAADRAEAVRPDDNDGTNFGIPDPAEEKEVRQELENKRSEKRAEEADAETNKKGHVKMHKNGADIHVHPSTVRDHEHNGWKLSA